MLARFAPLCLAAVLFSACSHAPTRSPGSFRPSYNPRYVQLLKAAADEGVFFQISDSVIRDLPLRSSGETCRSTGDGPWIEELYDVLEIFQKDPSLARKVHIVEFKRGDKPSVETSKDLDGAVTLLLLYSKSESREKIDSLSDIPCASGDMDLVGKDMSVTRFTWPSTQAIEALLQEQPERAEVERLNVDRHFMQWLAERQTLFRLTPELAFEKSPNGQPLLPAALARFSATLAQGNELPALDYWMSELGKKSKLGGAVKFFSLKKDNQMARGLQVDSVGQFARKMNGFADPTYPYVSYRLKNGTFNVGDLPDLDRCLRDLNSSYRSPISLMNNYEMDPGSFLYPGYHCSDNGSD
ncbi:MAG: hypothetical protein KF802_07875 [Bdellovibrionaceae bacterium]|nr:hypothetical protein [Pseudobdellovibrionaceae bacterium]MBX3034510.1 hypothetical protein [Pseudobdellovibrionaceae bacterium]